MSFFSVLQKIGNIVVGIERVGAPIISAIIPGSAPVFAILDPMFSRLQSTIQAVELNAPNASGLSKSQAVIADFQAGLQAFQNAAPAGSSVTYDGTALQAAINASVAALNAMATLKASIKIVPTVK